MAHSKITELELWRVAKVCQVTTLSRTTIWRMRREGTFPAPCELFGAVVAWRSTDVVAWMESRPQAKV